MFENLVLFGALIVEHFDSGLFVSLHVDDHYGNLLLAVVHAYSLSKIMKGRQEETKGTPTD